METTPQTELRRAYLMIEWGRLDDALTSCDRADAMLDASHPLPHALAGSFLSAFGHHAEALKRLRKAIGIDPTDTFANLTFAETCLFMGRRRQARRALERIDTGDPAMAGWRDQVAALEEQLATTQGIVVAR